MPADARSQLAIARESEALRAALVAQYGVHPSISARELRRFLAAAARQGAAAAPAREAA
jgi:hypothetical protein